MQTKHANTWKQFRVMALFTVLVSSLSAWPGLGAMAAETELVMIESKSCHVCKQFHREVGPDYNASKGASIFPLRMIDIDDGKIDISLQRPVTMTPTFIFVEKGKEIARVVGFPGREYFFKLVNGAAEEIKKLRTSSKTN